MAPEEKVLLEVEGKVATITLNRPERANAMNGDIWLGLEEAAKKIRYNPEVKAAVMKGAGNSFCSGLDLKAVVSEGISLRDHTLRGGYETLAFLSSIFTRYEKLPVPVIAAIHGGCIGVGMELALACDIRIASENSVFSIPEVVHNLVPDCGGTQRLPRIVGPGMAKELVFTGRRISAEEAMRTGLVNHLYAEDDLMEEAYRMVSEIAEMPEAAVQASKRALNIAMSSSMEDGLQYETSEAEKVLGDRARHIFHNE